jgi:hypothetical protein
VNKVAVYMYTSKDHTTDLVYTGTGSIHMQIDTIQDTNVSNHSINTCHLQELEELAS